MELTIGNMELYETKQEKEPVGGKKRRKDVERHLDHTRIVKILTVFKK